MKSGRDPIFFRSKRWWVPVILVWISGLVLSAVSAAPASEAPDPPLPPPAQIARPLTDTGHYLAPVAELRRRRAEYLASEQWRGPYLDFLGNWTSFIGNDREALQCFDQLDGPRQPTPAPAGPGPLTGYEGVDARETILRLAEKRRVVMVNEAHHVPLHRAFTLSLLRGLYQRGFRYFAAETLSVKDPELAARGYPVLRTGYYTMEPLHGELVREALRLGYRVVPYEAEGVGAIDGPGDPIHAMNERERIQALNLKERILDRDPGAKVLVHAGYGHIGEKAVPVNIGGKAGELLVMAARFKALTGIDPLTVDQTSRTEHSEPAYEHPVYRHAVETGRIGRKPRLFRNRRGEFYMPEGARGIYDLMVFHARSGYVEGRPSWRSLGGTRTPHRLPPDLCPPEDASYLAQAFHRAEPVREAIPVDQVELRAGERIPVLLLPRRGDFRIRVVDATGTTVREYGCRRR